MARFLENEESINAKDTVYMAQYLKPSRTDPSQKVFSLESFTYRVKSGDTLSSIAKRHNVSVAQLMKWNNLKKRPQTSNRPKTGDIPITMFRHGDTIAAPATAPEGHWLSYA